MKLLRSGFGSIYVIILFLFTNCSAQSNSKPADDTTYTYKAAGTDGIGKFYFGREIAHVMDASGAAWLERSDRQKEEHTEQAIDSLPLTPNSVVADVGAGTGFYSFRIAPKIPSGKIYAVEIQDAMINSLQAKKQQLQLNNVIITKGSTTSPNLPANSIDLAIMVDVYHELEYPHEMLQALYKALKPSGKLLLLEYRAEDPSIPIKALHKLSVEQANKEMLANGFVLYQRKEFLPIQHFLLYAKTGN